MDIQLPQLLFQIVNFSVVLGAVVYLLYKPLMKILDERADRVAQSLKEAEAAELEKEKLQAFKTKAKREAKKLAAKRRQELATETKETLTKEMQKAEARWQTEKQQMTANMKKQLVESVIQVSGMVIGKKLDKKTSEKLIAQGLEEALRSL